MNLLLLAAENGESVQQGLIDASGAVVGVGGLLLVLAWWAYLYR